MFHFDEMDLMNTPESAFYLAQCQRTKNSLNDDAYRGTCHSGSATQAWVL